MFMAPASLVWTVSQTRVLGKLYRHPGGRARLTATRAPAGPAGPSRVRRGRYQPGAVVLAAGAWSGGIARSLGLELPTRPVKGQLLLADCRVPPVSTPLSAGEALL